jgi:hypothetical protein
MPYSLFFDPGQRVLLVRFGKLLSAETLAAMRAAVRRFVAAQGECRAIVDFSAVEEATLPGRVVADAARSGPIIVSEMRVLVAPKPEIFGLSRMYELHQISTADNTLVVAALEEAYAALGIRALDLAPVEDTPGKPG